MKKKYLLFFLFNILFKLLPVAKAQPVFGTDAFLYSSALPSPFVQPLWIDDWAEQYYQNLYPWESSLFYAPFTYSNPANKYTGEIITDPFFYLQSRDFLSMSLNGVARAIGGDDSMIDEGTGTVDAIHNANDVPVSDGSWIIVVCVLLYGTLLILRYRKMKNKD